LEEWILLDSTMDKREESIVFLIIEVTA
jgi:hypothetical protein